MKILQVGQQVRVLEPFTRDFPDTYTIKEVIVNTDGQSVYILSDINGNDVNGGFAVSYLEVV